MNVTSIQTGDVPTVYGRPEVNRPLSGVQVVSALAISILIGAVTVLPLAIPAFFIIIAIMCASNSGPRQYQEVHHRGGHMQPSRSTSTTHVFHGCSPQPAPSYGVRASDHHSRTIHVVRPRHHYGAGRQAQAPGTSVTYTTATSNNHAPTGNLSPGTSVTYTTPTSNNHAPTGTWVAPDNRVIPGQR